MLVLLIRWRGGSVNPHHPNINQSIGSEHMVLFHITKDFKWKIGDIIQAGSVTNPFWNLCRDYRPTIICNNQRYDLFSFFSQYKGESFEVSANNLIWLFDTFRSNIKECAFYIREQIFEEIRKTYTPEHPSRQTCLWLTDLANLEYWKTAKSGGNLRILRMELDGTVFAADETWLHADTLSSVEYTQRAIRYWSGETSERNHIEYLFSGKAVIIDIEEI